MILLFDEPLVHSYYNVAFRSAWLGAVAGAGLVWFFVGPCINVFGIYIGAVAFFHLMEYLMTAPFKSGKDLNMDTFLLNQTVAYQMAFAFSVFEFLAECFLFPDFKLRAGWMVPVRAVGLVLVVAGQFFRSRAMWEAGRSFNHFVQSERRSDHTLVTKGLYAIIRHPSYFGFYWFSIGTQLLLGNPIGLVAYLVALQAFFASRIVDEEFHLCRMFPGQYEAYMARVHRWMPLIMPPARKTMPAAGAEKDPTKAQ
ncbi:hypothetical protein H696_01870 [Fonticula alba]|uniref:Protein-S-isoprenylcysteine O-methyltransferase n=1 Tax=Fonticula alba TaxID=691883 RepID=A0A058ZAC7_FONAL|nr:hypothetical protein H696_01870 [Fonticula alba]KCV70923.1 hypothetical protein H696_01870 [Fonticula alba]|eukprot:XP_009494046.1 hypothetical protein H696_01870 [Fonticula alba]